MAKVVQAYEVWEIKDEFRRQQLAEQKQQERLEKEQFTEERVKALQE